MLFWDMFTLLKGEMFKTPRRFDVRFFLVFCSELNQSRLQELVIEELVSHLAGSRHKFMNRFPSGPDVLVGICVTSGSNRFLLLIIDFPFRAALSTERLQLSRISYPQVRLFGMHISIPTPYLTPVLTSLEHGLRQWSSST